MGKKEEKARERLRKEGRIAPRMRKKRKALWVADLLTTEEPQGEGYLHTNDGYCCLGRECVVAIEAGLDLEIDTTGYRTSYGGDDVTLPYDVIKWAWSQKAMQHAAEWGHNLRSPRVMIDSAFIEEMGDKGKRYEVGQTDELASLNDDGVPFKTLAGLIDRNL